MPTPGKKRGEVFFVVVTASLSASVRAGWATSIWPRIRAWKGVNGALKEVEHDHKPSGKSNP